MYAVVDLTGCAGPAGGGVTEHSISFEGFKVESNSLHCSPDSSLPPLPPSEALNEVASEVP